MVLLSAPSLLEGEEVLRHLLELLPGRTVSESILIDHWVELLTLVDVDFHLLIQQMLMGCF